MGEVRIAVCVSEEGSGSNRKDASAGDGLSSCAFAKQPRLTEIIFPRIYARMYYAPPRARVMSFSAREPARFPSGNPPHALRLQHMAHTLVATAPPDSIELVARGLGDHSERQARARFVPESKSGRTAPHPEGGGGALCRERKKALESERTCERK